MRGFAALTVTGVAGVVLFKLLATIMVPILGIMVGLFFTTMKFALIAGVIFFVYSMIKKRKAAQEEVA